MREIERQATSYVETESRHAEKAVGVPYTQEAKDAAFRGYIRGFQDAVRRIGARAVYSGKGLLEYINQLKQL